MDREKEKRAYPFSAVRQPRRPLAHHNPLVRLRQRGPQPTRGGHVLIQRQGQLPVRKHLVLVRVQHHVVDAGGLVHEAVPVADKVLERVVDAHHGVGVAVAHRAPPVVVELLDARQVQLRAHGLVQQLDARDHVRVLRVPLG